MKKAIMWNFSQKAILRFTLALFSFMFIAISNSGETHFVTKRVCNLENTFSAICHIIVKYHQQNQSLTSGTWKELKINQWELRTFVNWSTTSHRPSNIPNCLPDDQNSWNNSSKRGWYIAIKVSFIIG